MHAQAEPERPKGEGHGWPEFYSPQMRRQWWSDIKFSLSRLSAAQTPCLAPTFEVPVILERRLKPAANLEHQAVFGLPAKLWAQAFAVKFEVDL